jgi:rhodanese-related sulfurtransferase
MPFRLCCALLATVIFIGALLIPKLGISAENWPGAMDDYVAHLSKTIRTIDMDAFLAIVKRPNGARIVDVREPEEFNAGHVPGTLNVPRSHLEQKIWNVLGYPKNIDMNAEIYVVCRSGARATFAAKRLKDIGFTDVTIVVMDIDDWERQGHPFVKGATRGH